MQKRMMVGVAALLTAYTLAATTVLAMFTPQAQAGALTFRTASHSLKLSVDPAADPPRESFGDTISLLGADKMYPGMTPVREKFWILNDSDTYQRLQLRSTFHGGDQDWDSLKYAIQINLTDLTHGMEGGWYTVGELESMPWPMPVPPLSPNEKAQIEIQYLMPANYPVDPDGDGPLVMDGPVGNEAMGKSTTANYLITGEVVADF